MHTSLTVVATSRHPGCCRLVMLIILLLGVLAGRPLLAQVVAPSRGSDVRLGRVTGTTMELRFSTPGPGQGRMVAMAATPTGVPVPLVASNNTFYAASPVFGRGAAIGQGYVVYCGPEYSVTVTGLLPNTTYYVASAEYNTDGTSIAYNINGNSISTTTLAETPLATATPATRGLDVYPSPGTRQQLQLALRGYGSEQLGLSLTDALGRTLLTQTLTPPTGSYAAPLALPSQLAPGTYTLTLTGTAEVIRRQFVLLD